MIFYLENTDLVCWIIELVIIYVACSSTSNKNRKSLLLISKASAHLACSFSIKCSSGLLIWWKGAHLCCSSAKKCSSRLLIWQKSAQLCCSSFKKCSSGLLIWKKGAHFCCSSNKKCSSFMLICKKKCSSRLLICAHIWDEHLTPLWAQPLEWLRQNFRPRYFSL